MTKDQQAAYGAMLVSLRHIIETNRDFRDQLPPDWDGDPLNDACEKAVKVLDFAEKHQPK